jgi:methionyl-tRNA formyltransferase
VKKDKPTAGKVINYLKTNFKHVEIYQGEINNKFPLLDVEGLSQDILVSYISPWIIPGSILDRTRLFNINFHPGPPEYPGIGCFNFAIYNEEETYGVTAHLMEEKVDTGRIIAIKRFPLLTTDSVYHLSIRSYEYMFSLFCEVFDYFSIHKELPNCKESWKCRPYKRKELEELCKVLPGMSRHEVDLRIKATAYPEMPGAYIELFGNKFEYNPNR